MYLQMLTVVYIQVSALHVCMYRERMYIQPRQNVFTDVYICVYTGISSSGVYVQEAVKAKCIHKCIYKSKEKKEMAYMMYRKLIS